MALSDLGPDAVPDVLLPRIRRKRDRAVRGDVEEQSDGARDRRRREPRQRPRLDPQLIDNQSKENRKMRHPMWFVKEKLNKVMNGERALERELARLARSLSD